MNTLYGKIEIFKNITVGGTYGKHLAWNG